MILLSATIKCFFGALGFLTDLLFELEITSGISLSSAFKGPFTLCNLYKTTKYKCLSMPTNA